MYFLLSILLYSTSSVVQTIGSRTLDELTIIQKGKRKIIVSAQYNSVPIVLIRNNYDSILYHKHPFRSHVWWVNVDKTENKPRKLIFQTLRTSKKSIIDDVDLFFHDSVQINNLELLIRYYTATKPIRKADSTALTLIDSQIYSIIKPLPGWHSVFSNQRPVLLKKNEVLLLNITVKKVDFFKDHRNTVIFGTSFFNKLKVYEGAPTQIHNSFIFEKYPIFLNVMGAGMRWHILEF